MHWYGEFKSVFFTAWAHAGLPGPEAYAASYAAWLREFRSPYELPALPVGPNDPLHPDTLDSVYSFGVHAGFVCGRLLGLPAKQAEDRARWCGQFNLGISLFDYLCDEAGRVAAVIAAPAFLPFQKPRRPARAVPPQRPAEVLLNSVVSHVLEQLAQEIGAPTPARLRSGMWHALNTMFEAEVFLARLARRAPLRPAQVRRALQAKSVGPFQIMAEWMARGQRRAAGPEQLRRARQVGNAIGHCYWLVDDAKDLWLDLSNQHWNVFLLQAATVEPRLFRRPRDGIIDAHLAQVLTRSQVARRRSRSAVRRLSSVLSTLPIPSGARRQALGHVAASIARW